MTESNPNTYYQDDSGSSLNFGTESLLDGLVEIFVPCDKEALDALYPETEFETLLEG